MYNFVITYKTGEIVQFEINRTDLVGYVIERCNNNE